ncbi:MAG TPA: DUF4173 domain-containing protein [Gemmatimonadales bacterium]|nr:DUF4173 domain-containing protein [Gemmatimonadales bacterium]
MRTRLALDVLITATLLGVCGDLLLRVMPWGVNVSLASLALVAGGAVLVRRHQIPVSADAPWLGLTIVLLGAAFGRRDSAMLQTLDVIALIGVLGITVLATQGGRLWLRGVTEYATAVGRSTLQAMLGVVPLLATDVQWHEVPRREALHGARAVMLGVVLALPLLIVFGALFAGADSVFNGLVQNLIAVNLSTAVSHVVFAGFWAVLVAGYLRGALLAPPGAGPPADRSPTLGLVPVGTALGLVNLLFLLFVVVQARYFFGGTSLVEQTTGLTYAEYARGGFFQLVWASVLVLPVLLGADWLVRRESTEHVRSFRYLAGLLLVQLAVVMVSALARMRLYVAAYGLSEIRLFATAGMVYLALLFGWFAATVLRGRRAWFASGGLVEALAVLSALHIANPDALIVRHNLTRPPSERLFDASYAVSLGADAVPVLLDALPRLEPKSRCDAARRLLNLWDPATRPDWRSWTWPRGVARRLVAAHATQLAVPCVGTDDDPSSTAVQTP